MCVTCGCSATSATTTTSGTATARPDTPGDGGWHTHADGTSHSHAHGHEHDHGHAHGHEHEHERVHEHEHDAATAHARLHGRTVKLEQDLLARNQLLAERNRGWFAGRNVLALNLVSSPGSGKTSLLERTIRDNRTRWQFAVIEGDQATQNDAERIRATGADAVQINTGTGCHLDAAMLQRGLHQLQPAAGSIVMIENVGNLVCPALFDLGEAAKVLVMSVTEGEDKPAKYPHMFRAASVLLLNKIDLLPHLRFDLERCLALARSVNPAIEILQVSAQTGAGMAHWYQWLAGRQEAMLAQRPAIAGGDYS